MKCRSSGFTLIEVLVAIAIVAIGMAAVLEALTSSANTVIYLRDKTLAEWVGLNQIATTRLALQPGQVPPTGNTTGDLDYAGRSWHWRQEVTALPQVKGMVRIDVKVRPADVKAGDDNGWFATVSGVTGDALAPAVGTTPLYNNSGIPGQGCGSNAQQGAGGQNCNNPTQTPCPAGTVCPNPTQSNGTGSGSTGTNNGSNTNSGTNAGSTNTRTQPPQSGGLGSTTP